MKLSILIPVYNEQSTIAEMLSRVSSLDIHKEVIIVDDCSTDGTREYLYQLSQDPSVLNSDGKNEIRIFFHPNNQGKGAALRTAIGRVTGEVVIVQDADLEYDPRDYFRLLEPIWDGRADVVYGSRFLGGPHRVLYFWHYVGNKILTTLSNMLTNLNLSDMETCYKCFRAEVIKKINIRSNRFGFEPEVTAKVAKLKCRIYEVPISYSGRTYEEGKKITWRDGIAALFHVIRYRFFD